MIQKGKKICIRNLRIEDLPDYEKWNQTGQKWQDFDGPYYPRVTGEELIRKINGLKGKIEDKNFLNPIEKAAIADLETNELIGQVSWYWQGKETNWVSVGIVIYNPDFWDKGIGYEALGLWSDYLFREMPTIVRLDIRTWSGNLGMMKLAEKLGYKQEACFRNARIVNGEYYDSIGYGILREEWESLYLNHEKTHTFKSE